jgi:hypothetical protein
MKTQPFHSARPGDKQVYHDNTSCTEGNNIEDRYKRQGTAGRPLCQRCASLS